MKPEELYVAVITIGHEEDASELRPAVIEKLIEMNMLTRRPGGRLWLTKEGDKAFSKIEGGDEVTEFEAVL